MVALLVVRDPARDSHAAVRAMRAAYYGGRDDDALAAAEALFATPDGATARQVAGAIRQARDELDIARPLLEAALAGHRARHEDGEQARDAQLLAGIAMKQGKLGEALAAAELADREARITADTRLQGSTQLALGKIMVEIGDYAAARTALWQAQGLLAAWPTDRAWAYLELGMLVRAIGDQAGGAKLLDTALDLASRYGVDAVVAAAHLNLAYACRELGQLDEADRHIRALAPRDRDQPSAQFVAGLIAADRGDVATANRLLATAAARASGDDYGMDIAFQRGRLAQRAGDLAAAEAQFRDAVRFVEAMRRDTSSVELRPWVLARRREPYEALLGLLAQQDRRLEALAIAEGLHARAWVDALIDHSTGEERRAWLAATAPGLPEDAARGILPVSELLAILGEREALVFADTGGELWRFHIVAGKVARLDHLGGDVAAAVEAAQRAPDDAAAAERLGDALIPREITSSPQQPLYIVANGRLDPVPFAALRRDGRFLVEDRVIVRLPGIATLRCRKVGERPRKAVFIGDAQEDLPSAHGEALALAREIGGEGFVGKAASSARLKESRMATLLHLAVHATAGASGSRVVMSDASVSTTDIIANAIAPRVTVLAGCATAASRDAEGWDALSSAFLVAGSRTVVATLSSVDDRDATEFVTRFYAHGGEHHPARAVAETQRELLGTRPARVWSAFTVLGGADASDCAP